jgi:hypothetical protein
MFNVFHLHLLTFQISPETLLLNSFAHFCIALLRHTPILSNIAACKVHFMVNDYVHHLTPLGAGIATGRGLDGQGIESLWGRDFSHTSKPGLGLTQPPVQWVPGLSRG